MTPSEITSFLWGVVEQIRDTVRRGKYQDVILPMTVLRQIDCVLKPTKEKVLERFDFDRTRTTAPIRPGLTSWAASRAVDLRL